MKNINSREKFDYRNRSRSQEVVLNYEYCVYANESYDTYMWEIEKEILTKEVALIQKKDIHYLDFACGTGRILSFVEQFVSDSTGVDVSENMINLARNKIKKSTIILADLTKKDVLKYNTYDLITAFRFFLNAQEDLRKDIMRVLSSKLTDDGTFIFNIHGNIYSSYFFLFIWRRFFKKHKLSGLISYYDMKKSVLENQLKIVRIYGVGIIPYPFYKFFKYLSATLFNIDRFFYRIGIFKYLSTNIIFVCKRCK